MRRALVPALYLLLAGCDVVFDLERGATGDAVAVYSMNGLDGTTLPDDSGHHHEGTCASCPTLTTGVHGGALLFDGATEVVTIRSAPALEPLDGMTLSLWLRLDATIAIDMCPISKLYAPPSAANSWQLCTDSDTLLSLYATTTAGPTKLVGTGLAVGTWHHAAARWDGAMIQLLIDGAVVNQAPGALLFDDGDVLIGADIDRNMTFAFFPGAIDDVRVFGRAITDQELAALARR